ncbi:MAG: BLUF domain-containing protein [Brevundimonas sp.]|uniref:BLUF domain-containing protein n=1 Tax=Brevundimonas sp. TaxID=1871086 RepID=UPI002724F305|nr:BLUF domain-containing protein [Brevundimonas sp.]MDO9588539.1 BLUF domain-containing protein [Brevundimonas sp.]
MHSNLSALSGEQVRAGRALARIDQSDLAKRCGLSLETIKRLERIRGPVDANSRTLRALVEVFSGLGVAFDSCEDGGMGVCLVSGAPSRTPVGIGRSSGAVRKTDRRTPEAGCHRLIYHSTANPADPRPLHELLEQVQVAGAQRKVTMDVTGILFAHDGRFLSVLEGPKDSVRQVYGAISCDRRHTSLSIISDQPAPGRRFPDWSVCCGLFQSDSAMVGDEPALRDGFEGLSPASALGLLSVMRDLKEMSPRKNLKSRCPCPLAGACLDRACASFAAGSGQTESADDKLRQSASPRS